MRHRFNLGQLVCAAGSRFPDRTNGVYEIVRLLPERNGEFAYRIRETSGSGERAVGESEIRSADGETPRSEQPISL
jgi:hypothetical protein